MPLIPQERAALVEEYQRTQHQLFTTPFSHLSNSNLKSKPEKSPKARTKSVPFHSLFYFSYFFSSLVHF